MGRLFLVCPGLGHVQRGYETFSRQCFEVFKNDPEVEVFLIKGAGRRSDHEFSIFTIKRDSFFAKILSKMTGKPTYDLEQISFFISLLPRIFYFKPDIIYFPDFYLGCLLFHLKRIFKFKYTLLFHNGAPNGPPFNCCDYVQHAISKYMVEAIEKGEDPKRHFHIPIGIDMDKERPVLTEEEKFFLKRLLHLPENKKIILSVGAVNSHHKRMDYLIREFSMLNKDEFFLIILGQFEETSFDIVSLADELIKKGNYLITTVNKSEINNYYQLSDYFALSTFAEGFGIAYIEAMSFGLPVMCHDTFGTREVLGNLGNFGDFRKEGELSRLLNKINLTNISEKIKRKEFVFNKYSWSVLGYSYKEMIYKILSNEAKN